MSTMRFAGLGRALILTVGLGLVITPNLLTLPAAVAVSPVPVVAPFATTVLAPHVPHRVLVHFRPGTPDALKQSLHARLGTRLERVIPRIDVEVLRVPGDVAAAVHAYRARPEVAFAEPDFLVASGVEVAVAPGADPVAAAGGRAAGTRRRPPASLFQSDRRLGRALGHAAGGDALTVVPNDPEYPNQWHHAKIDSPAAWDRARATGIRIGIVSSGIDCAHPDLAGACVEGFDFVDNDADATDDDGSGTLHAGIVAATVDNGVGVAGVGWGATLMPLKVFDGRGGGSDATVAAGMVWAVDRGVDVLHLGVHLAQPSATVERAVAHAVAADVVMVAPMGNRGGNVTQYPAALPGVVAVGATDANDARAAFSNSGGHIALSAPGEDVMTTALGGGYSRVSGTGESTAVVAGLAALILGQRPDRTPAEVLQLLIDTAVDLGAPGWDPGFGWGRVDAGAALAAQPATATPVPTPTDLPTAEPTATPPPASATPTPAPTAMPTAATCSRPWRIRLHAFPDTVGVGGYRCPGCDHVFSGADRLSAAGCALESIQVVVHAAGDPRVVYANVVVPRAAGALSLQTTLALCAPPPYAVTLLTPESACYVLCPNSPSTRVLTDAYFAGGRWTEVGWSFWSCHVP